MGVAYYECYVADNGISLNCLTLESLYTVVTIIVIK